MPRQVHYFDRPQRFVTGTVGMPGERTFYLQAADGSRIVSVKLEKAQVAVLADRLDELLDEVRRRDPESDVPTEAPAGIEDSDPLDQPLLEEFRVGTMALAWDGDEALIVVEAHAVTDEETAAEVEPLSESEEGPDVLRVRLTPAFARAFASRARKVVAAGRPPCPLCGLPLDPDGHVCPRQNGHRKVEA